MIIAANWKAYVSDLALAKRLFAAAKKAAGKHTIVLAPPAPFFSTLANDNRSKVAFSAQDVSRGGAGAHTGESTAAMYASSGARYAIVGHSERRAAGDTLEDVAVKLENALAAGLTPILCVGERERDARGQYLSFLREELASAFAALRRNDRTKVIIAYEPIWAIGKSAKDAMQPDDLVEMVLYIRKVLAELTSQKHSREAQILYGGSVEPGNIRELAESTGVQGFLIGHAAAEPASFAALVTHLS